MKAIIKKLLDELIGLTPLAESTLLNKAFEEMGISDAQDVAGKLLFWQKGIINPIVPPSENRKEDKLTLEIGPVQRRFKAFFEHNPIINELFVLENNSVTYSNNLTSEEIKAIQVYVDKHHLLPFHVRGLGTKYI